MPVALPSVSNAIIYGVVILIGIVGIFFFQSYLIPWFQKWQDMKDQKAVEDARAEILKQNQKANDESDKLKDIEGR